VELDAGFVDAYFGVAGALSNLKRESDARRYAEEGYRRSSKLDENLRLTYEISLRHYSYDFEGEIDCLKRQQILHPLDWGVPNVLAHISSYVYQDPSSAELYARAAYQKDRHWMNLDQLMNSLKLQGKTNEMRDVIADFQRTGGVPIKALFYGMLIPLVENRWGEVEKIIAQLEQDPGWGREVGASYRLQALLAAGKLSDAREATASAWRAGRERGWSGLQYTSDLRRQWLDLRLEGKQPAFSTEQAEMARASLLNLPEIAAFCVDSGTEEPLAGMLAYHGQAEKDSKSRYVLEELQFARACLDLIRGQANRAQANLEPLARNSLFVRRHRVLGRAYEALGMWPQAAAEYEKGLKNPYLKWWSFENPAVWVLDQFRLAKVYERIGDKDSARQWYERFLADWKDADPDIPELKQARQQLAALGASQTAPRH
jgi:tetratricopeptide (TPR) repeat protein